jgi:hypothetical protein
VKGLLALLTIVLLSVVVLACGDAGSGTGPASPLPSNSGVTRRGQTSSSSTSSHDFLQSDGDKDKDESSHPSRRLDDDVSFFASYGSEASGAVEKTVALAVKRYYAAAAAEDGARACQLVAFGLASGFGHASCASGLSLLFRQHHAQLVAEDVATMVIISVHLKGDLGVAELGFRAMPRSEILIARERGAWKVDALFESEVT